jgi:hypothetical protein
MDDTCDDCTFCKEKSGSQGKCKVGHAETHIAGLGNTTSRTNGWPIVNLTDEACGQFQQAPPV